MKGRAFALILLILLAPGCGRESPQAPAAGQAQEPLVLAVTPYAGAAPAFVAMAQGYFEKEGLQVVVQSHPSGRETLNAVIASSADVATVSELPVTLAVLRGHPVTLLATMSTQTDYGVVGRLDRGISTKASLRGKRIAVSTGTSGDFFLDTLLVRQRLSRSDVHVIDRKPSEMADALEMGEADAIATWEPYVSEVRDRLGSNATVFSSEGVYESTFNLAARRDFTRKRGETVKKILLAVARAEQFIAEDPVAAEKIVAQALKKSVEETRRLMQKHRFSLSIEQNLIVMMEDVSRWAVKNKLVDANETPNFLDAIYVDGLAVVRPRSVTVFR